MPDGPEEDAVTQDRPWSPPPPPARPGRPRVQRPRSRSLATAGWAGDTPAWELVHPGRLVSLRRPAQPGDPDPIPSILALIVVGLVHAIQLPRTYDDGGLVDVVSAPAEVISRVCGIAPQEADEVVRARDAAAGNLVSVDDLGAWIQLSAPAWEQVRDRGIVLGAVRL